MVAWVLDVISVPWLVAMGVYAHFPARPVLGPCFSTGDRSIKPLLPLFRQPPDAFGVWRLAEERM